MAFSSEEVSDMGFRNVVFIYTNYVNKLILIVQAGSVEICCYYMFHVCSFMQVQDYCFATERMRQWFECTGNERKFALIFSVVKQ